MRSFRSSLEIQLAILENCMSGFIRISPLGTKTGLHHQLIKKHAEVLISAGLLEHRVFYDKKSSIPSSRNYESQKKMGYIITMKGIKAIEPIKQTVEIFK